MLTLTILSGCATKQKSSLLGAGIGSVLGGTIGNAHGKGDDRNKTTTNGALIGAAIGGLIGYLSDEKKPTNANYDGVIIDIPSRLQGQLPPPPRISKPIVTVREIDQQKVGSNKVRGKSVEWVIKRGCEWVVE